MTLVNLRDFLGVATKLKKSMFKNSNQIKCYNQNMGFVNRIDQSVANYRIGTQMKKWWWYPFV